MKKHSPKSVTVKNEDVFECVVSQRLSGRVTLRKPSSALSYSERKKCPSVCSEPMALEMVILRKIVAINHNHENGTVL